MKLIIFTPTIKASAIGRMACLVTRSLVSLGHEVVVVRAEAKALLSGATHDFGVKMVRWDDERSVTEAALDADSIVYQIGDNFPFHEGCLEWMPRMPGIVCLHDFFLGHLFHGWAEKRPEAADAILRQWYGKEGARIFFDPSSNSDFISRTCDVAPMTEWVCSQANAVITHSQWGTPRVIRSCPGPVEVVPLAYDAPELHADEQNVTRSREGYFSLLTIGHINANKRVASVLRAIGSSPLLRTHCVYRLVGHIQPAAINELSALASTLRVNLVITGEADDATLAVAVADADVVSCLRWPSLEAASASAIEAMLYGKATIVTDTGFYREIPDECVVKIGHANEVKNLRAVLEKLYLSPVDRDRVGGAAKAWATATYSADEYSRRILGMIDAASKVHARDQARRFFLDVLAKWNASNLLVSVAEKEGPLSVSGRSID